MIKNKYNKTVKMNEFLFIISYILFLIRSAIGNTTFSEYIKVYGSTLAIILLACGILLAIKTIVIDKFVFKDVCFILVTIVLFFSSYYKSQYSDIIILMILLCSTKNIEFKKIVKTHFIVYGSVMILALISSLIGIIENYSIYSVHRGIRYALGNTYPTDFSSGVFYLLIDFVYLKYQNWEKKYSLIMIIISYIVYKYTDAKTSFILSSFLALSMFFIKFDFLKSKIFRQVVAISFIFLAVFSIYIQYIYSSIDILSKIDKMINYRISYGAQALKKYDLSFLGNRIDFTGNGWGTEKNIYFYVDNGYLQMALLYGVGVLSYFCIGYYMAIKKEELVTEISLLLLLLIAISGVFEPRFFNILYNPFIFIISIRFLNYSNAKKNI